MIIPIVILVLLMQFVEIGIKIYFQYDQASAEPIFMMKSNGEFLTQGMSPLTYSFDQRLNEYIGNEEVETYNLGRTLSMIRRSQFGKFTHEYMKAFNGIYSYQSLDLLPNQESVVLISQDQHYMSGFGTVTSQQFLAYGNKGMVNPGIHHEYENQQWKYCSQRFINGTVEMSQLNNQHKTLTTSYYNANEKKRFINIADYKDCTFEKATGVEVFYKEFCKPNTFLEYLRVQLDFFLCYQTDPTTENSLSNAKKLSKLSSYHQNKTLNVTKTATIPSIDIPIVSDSQVLNIIDTGNVIIFTLKNSPKTLHYLTQVKNPITGEVEWKQREIAYPNQHQSHKIQQNIGLMHIPNRDKELKHIQILVTDIAVQYDTPYLVNFYLQLSLGENVKFSPYYEYQYHHKMPFESREKKIIPENLYYQKTHELIKANLTNHITLEQLKNIESLPPLFAKYIKSQDYVLLCAFNKLVTVIDLQHDSDRISMVSLPDLENKEIDILKLDTSEDGSLVGILAKEDNRNQMYLLKMTRSNADYTDFQRSLFRVRFSDPQGISKQAIRKDFKILKTEDDETVIITLLSNGDILSYFVEIQDNILVKPTVVQFIREFWFLLVVILIGCVMFMIYGLLKILRVRIDLRISVQ